jgi:hypothetical protein
MADERLAELRRSWEQGGDPADGARYAHEAMRHGQGLNDLEPALGALVLGAWRDEGQLTADQVRLAALGGHPAARELEGDLPAESGGAEWIQEALRLQGLGSDLYRGWFCGLGRRVADVVTLELPDPDLLPRLHEVLDAQEAAPSDAQARSLSALADALAGWAEDGTVHEAAYLESEGDPDAAERAVGAVHTLIGLCQALCWSQEEGGSTSMQDPAWGYSSPLPHDSVIEAARLVAVDLGLRRREAPVRDRAIAYTPKRRYREGERLTHPTFGEGEVVRAAGRQVHVRFGDEVKKLAQGLG